MSEFGFRRIRLVGEGLYLFCLNRETKPGFGHSDQVSLAFRLTFACTKNSAARIRQSVPVSMCRLRDRSSSLSKPLDRKRFDSRSGLIDCLAELTKLAWLSPFDERNARRMQRARSECLWHPCRTQLYLECLLCLPTAPALPIEGNGDFGTSPIYEQLSDKPLLV